GPTTIMAPTVAAGGNSMARSLRSCTPRGPTRSPQALSRGKRALSTSATRAPPRASTRAATLPAGPAPITRASKRLSGMPLLRIEALLYEHALGATPGAGGGAGATCRSERIRTGPLHRPPEALRPPRGDPLARPERTMAAGDGRPRRPVGAGPRPRRRHGNGGRRPPTRRPHRRPCRRCRPPRGPVAPAPRDRRAAAPPSP